MEIDDDLRSFVQVRVTSLEGLFRGDQHLYLPWAQRAYAWQEDNASRLLLDILNAQRAPQQRYFLGYVSLSGPEPGDRYAVVDGQQRIITLSLVFALLRERVSNPALKARLQSCLVSGAEPNEPVIAVQPHFAGFFRSHLLGGPIDLQGTSSGPLSESEENIVLNTAALTRLLDEVGAEGAAAEALAEFLLRRCAVAIEVVADQAESLQMLATEEETGLPFHSSERAKVTLVSLVARPQQQAAAHIWEVCQARIGNEGLGRLLCHLRLIGAGRDWRGRSRTPVETDIAELFHLDRDGLAFMERVLAPMSRHLADLRSRAFERASVHGRRIADALDMLDWLEWDLWQPAALVWASQHGLAHPEAPAFFVRLERLAWLHRIAGTDPVKREQVFAEMVADLQDGLMPDAIEAFAISSELTGRVLENLRSRTFYYKPFAPLVLRRISLQMGEDPGPRDGTAVTVEHVLPRRPRPESSWSGDFGRTRPVSDFSDRIGNFAFLSFAENQAADNHDWARKREILRRSSFVLAREAASWRLWTPDTVVARSEKLIAALYTSLGLPPPSSRQ